MTTNDILLGLGLVLVLAVSSQLLAWRLHIPAIVLLLPARPNSKWRVDGWLPQRRK